MQHEATATERMKRLLEPISPSWLATQLGVTPQTVNHWKHGRHVSQDRLEDAAEAIRGLLPEHQPDEAPGWARDLPTRDEIQALAAGIEDRITSAFSEATAAHLVDRFVDDLRERAPQLFGGDAPAGSQ